MWYSIGPSIDWNFQPWSDDQNSIARPVSFAGSSMCTIFPAISAPFRLARLRRRAYPRTRRGPAAPSARVRGSRSWTSLDAVGSRAVIFQPELETLPRRELEQLQLERLSARFGVGSFEELAGQPFATKSMLRDAYPFGLLRVPLSDCVRVHGSSGTRGKPTIVAYTRGDVERWADCCARALAAAGAEAGADVHRADRQRLFPRRRRLPYRP